MEKRAREDMNYAREKYAENLHRDNARKLEMQDVSLYIANTLEAIAGARHDLHSYTIRGNGDIEKIMEIYEEIADRIDEIKTELGIEFSRINYDSADFWTFDIYGQGMDEELDEELGVEWSGDEDEKEIADTRIYTLLWRDGELKNEFNRNIEKFLEKVDDIYGTQYKPTGSNRVY